MRKNKIGYTRISKQAAARRYKAGKTVYIHPENLLPIYMTGINLITDGYNFENFVKILRFTTVQPPKPGNNPHFTKWRPKK